MAEAQWQRGKEWLERALALMGIPVAVKAPSAELVAACDAEAQWLVIDETALTQQQLESLLGADGAPLDALQYWANTLLNLGLAPEAQSAYAIELNGYRQRRQQQLQDLAERVAQQVRESGQESYIESLSSAERRQVHTWLKQYRDLETYSRGQEPNRYLAVRYRPERNPA